MNLIVKHSPALSGTIMPPSSKSQSIRGMIFALLAKGESILNNILHADDSNDAVQVCKQLGATITLEKDKLILKSNGIPLQNHAQTIHTGNSGITTRFILPALGLRKDNQQPIILDCGTQMRARPIHSLVNALRNLGMTIQYLENENTLPAAVSGKLTGGKTRVDGITSQFISALLISLPLALNDSEIIVDNLHERPYVEMTMQWLKEQKIRYTHHQAMNTDYFYIEGRQTYHPIHTVVPGDFSSASYLIASAALTKSNVTLQGLSMQDPQGDKRLVNILQSMGADISTNNDSITIRGGKALRGIKIDANDIPDLLPVLAVIATQAISETSIYSVPQARLKETDRIHSMTEGLTHLGAKISEQHDGMIIQPSSLHGGKVLGYDDHRTVMALSIAGMLAKNSTVITDAHAINKTFPNYVNTMRSLGANMEITHE